MGTGYRVRNAVIVLIVVVLGWPAFQSHGRSSPRAMDGRVVPTAPARTAHDATDAQDAAPQKADFLASDPSGWIDMMPHKSFKRWTRVPVPPDKPLDPVSQWKLAKNPAAIICEGDHGHEWLRYNHQYGNFILHVEWRFKKLDGPHGYNSGVFVRNDLTGRVWHQAQVGTRAYIFGQTLLHGQLSPTTKTPPPQVDPLHAVGEWNTYEIRCLGPNITLWVNGDWTANFAAPEAPRGYWGLEAERYWIEFRNIKLKKLK